MSAWYYCYVFVGIEECAVGNQNEYPVYIKQNLAEQVKFYLYYS